MADPSSSRTSSSTATLPEAPSSKTKTTTSTSTPLSKSRRAKQQHFKALESILSFLRSQSCYSILPESFRLVSFDNDMVILSALNAMTQNGVVSAPLWDNETLKFAGMFTLTDVIHLIQYYYVNLSDYDDGMEQVSDFRLYGLRAIELSLRVAPPPTLTILPDAPLHEACELLIRTHARRLPVMVRDAKTRMDGILAVLTTYRVLKYVAVNCPRECRRLNQSIGSLGVGSYVTSYEPPVSPTQEKPPPISATSTPSSSTTTKPTVQPPTSPSSDPKSPDSSSSGPDRNHFANRFHPLAVATLDTTVFDVIHIFSDRGISAVPIVDPETGQVIDLYETVDAVDLTRTGAYRVLDLTIGEALKRRGTGFMGVFKCTPEESVAGIMECIKEKRVHRFVIVEGNKNNRDGGGGAGEKGTTSGNNRNHNKLVGILTLSDVLAHLLGVNVEKIKGEQMTMEKMWENAAAGGGGIVGTSGDGDGEDGGIPSAEVVARMAGNATAAGRGNIAAGRSDGSGNLEIDPTTGLPLVAAAGIRPPLSVTTYSSGSPALNDQMTLSPGGVGGSAVGGGAGIEDTVQGLIPPPQLGIPEGSTGTGYWGYRGVRMEESVRRLGSAQRGVIPGGGVGGGSGTGTPAGGSGGTKGGSGDGTPSGGEGSRTGTESQTTPKSHNADVGAPPPLSDTMDPAADNEPPASAAASSTDAGESATEFVDALESEEGGTTNTDYGGDGYFEEEDVIDPTPPSIP